MSKTKEEMIKWHQEQVRYFSEYLSKFDKNSSEYNVIEKGIENLKQIVI